MDLVYDANRRRYAEDKFSKKYNFWPPIRRPLKLSPPKVEKPKSGTELYHYANFHTNRLEITIPGQKYIFFFIEDSAGGFSSMPYIL